MTWQEIVTKLLESGQALGSKAFEISLMQVYNVVRIDAIWAIVLIVIALALFFTGYKIYKYNKNAGYNSGWEKFDYICHIVGCLALLFSGLLWTNVVMYLGNPQWYAARWMLEDLLGK